MKTKVLNKNFLAIAGLILFAAFMRLIPHWPNFTPVAAIALFGGAHIKRKELAFAVPIIALLVSDLVIGFHENMLAVYGAFALVVGMGFFLRNRVKVYTVAGAALGSSVIFFLITNAAVWLTSPLYAPGFAGLIQSYTAGLPFFYNGILGNLFFSGAIFGTYYMMNAKIPTLQRAKA